jgi:hypothetical protein
MKFKKAPAGTYLVRAQTNNTVADDYAYQGLATLAVAGAAPATPPASTPPASTPPASAPAPGATLTIRTRSASAKRAKGKLKVGVSSDQAVTQVVATLSKGKKKVGTGKLATLSGNGTVTVKVPRKLKPGSYSIAVTAKDQRGATVGAAAKLKIKR